MADSVTERSESKEKVKRDRRQSSEVSGEGAWINAHHDPVASLYTFTSCIDLKDLDGDGDHKLLIGDLASGQHDMKLKIFKGTQVSHEIPLLDLPTGVIAFMMDTNEPAIAVASNTYVYIYKTVRPYFKFTLPLLEINSQENQLWEQAKEDEIDPTQLRDGLEALSSSCCNPPLTERSLTFLQLDAEDLFPFTSIFKPIPLKRQVHSLNKLCFIIYAP
ncbi:PREDICTED: Bardet-Biedl syndrome 1 protein-like [Amphimedon queenslandica]|uniref:Bardet-Biedl syndrome 1 N-terminal domain-containing protein n=1 Tax=Amphimedon queenslandica TaxID=400682 RepID=A0AAN0J445_AMPQE|nr:PREDICTED: Bardet-Biedl syndrome 1 protein-like [Amphimedon queenslandica]|eukprot:XP_019851770.1 PREDICTED: Bardet-Biedl syndrome 1 protein-like [Amphimedon queenslandica]